MKLSFVLFFLFLLSTYAVYAQADSSSAITFSGYIEAYYAHDFNVTANNERPSFIYNYKQTNQPSINIGLLKVGYQKKAIRANLGLMAGNYVKYNLATEPDGLRNLYEANLGVSLSKTKSLWLDAGIFPSHIGLATPIGKDNFTLTRSLASENSPYYETGIRLSYTSANQKWYTALLALNGWQRIEGLGRMPSLGTQLTFKPSSALQLNSSSYVGLEKRGGTESWRVFHNLFIVYQSTPKHTLAACFDIGKQQQLASTNWGTWYTVFVQNKYAFTNKWSATARIEYYSDKQQFLIQIQQPFQTFGYSLNLDYLPIPSTIIRIEGKLYNSKETIFTKPNGNATTVYSALTAAVAFAF
jgi:hypothetical protein